MSFERSPLRLPNGHISVDQKSLVWEKLNKKILFNFVLFVMDSFYNIRNLVSVWRRRTRSMSAVVPENRASARDLRLLEKS